MILDQIQVFKTVVELGSFRAASDELNRAQSAVSYAIRQLEAELEFPLFDRSKYRAKLTPEGHAFYKKSLSLFESVAELDTYAKSLKRGCEPEVRLAVSALFPLKPILKSLEQLRWRHPQTEVKLIVDILGADQLLLNNQVDLAITEVRNNSTSLENYHLGKLNLKAVGSPKGEFLKMKKSTRAPLTKEDLKKFTQIVLRSSPLASERTAGVLNKANTWSVTDFLSKKELLLSGLGWGYMPEHLIEKEIKTGELVELLSEAFSLDIHLCYLRSKTRGPSAQFLLDSFKQIDLS